MENRIVKAKKETKSKYKLRTVGNPVTGKIIGNKPMQRDMPIKASKY